MIFNQIARIARRRTFHIYLKISDCVNASRTFPAIVVKECKLSHKRKVEYMKREVFKEELW